MHATCNAIREELDDHREAINEGIRDNAEVRDALGELDERVEKLASRIDELFLLLGAEQTLTPQEAALQAFLQTPRTMASVASFLDESPARAERLVRSLFLKGVGVAPVGNGAFITTNLGLQKNTPLDSYF
jgi:hypothetical protein